MIRRFWKDIRANYALATAIATLPIMGGVAFAVDYSEMLREKQAMMHALDAAGIATARQIVAGGDDAALVAYANDFFDANLGPVDPDRTTLDVHLPSTENGGGTLSLSAELDYKPYFYPVFTSLLGDTTGDGTVIKIGAHSKVRLKNTLEVALVLDNSGSMDDSGVGSGQKRIDLLKGAAKELVATLADEAEKIKQVDRPVQFGLVPFASSVNVGPEHAGDPWMDTYGISPIHHENFDWSTLDEPDRKAVRSNGVWYKSGSGWDTEEGDILSRFSLYKDMKQVESREWVSTGREYVCTSYYYNGACRRGHWEETGHYDETISSYASWQGCVEARPYPYNVDDTEPNAGVGEGGVIHGTPETLFVPMFGPDEPGDRWKTDDDDDPEDYDAANNWWNDGTEAGGQTRLRNVAKYFEVRPYGATAKHGTGPNYSCTTNPITPLVDVTTEDGMSTITTAIDAMAPNGGTNVPEGMAWGWRVVSGGEPFTEGRPDRQAGNDKVVIVLTDGKNTYYTPGSLGFHDPAHSESIYSSYGYLQPGYGTSGVGRLFQGTDSSVGNYDYSNGNYTDALNQQMTKLCGNAKDAGLLVMTVALDLDSGKADENDAIEALSTCASDSRFRKDPNDPSKPKKLFWNATSSDLEETFKDIARELSNLRIVS